MARDTKLRDLAQICQLVKSFFFFLILLQLLLLHLFLIDQMIDGSWVSCINVVIRGPLILINVRGTLCCLCASAQIQEDEVQQERSANGNKGAEAAGHE